MNDKPTLRDLLAARRAQALLDTPNARYDSASFSTEDIAAALRLLGEPELDIARLSLLGATINGANIQRAALEMTPSRAQRTLTPRTRRAHAVVNSPSPENALTASGLDALSDGAWAECARWLAEQAGYTIEERPLLQRDALLAWQARGKGASSPSAVVCAIRLPPGAPVLDLDVRRLHAIAGHEPDARLVIFTTAEASVGARLLAAELSAHLLDRPEIERLLASLATAFARERAQSRDDARAQAKAASAARKKIVTALSAAAELVKAPPGARRASGRPAVRKAVETAREARRLASQALLAWQTLVADWSATFAERPARDGSLSFQAQPEVWAELGARADHLKKPLLDALRALGKTPGDGDLGYGAWRQALGEEQAARCAALLWRAGMIDPARWEDYASAVNDNAAREASLADNAATHAGARAERAQSELTERAGAF